MSAFNRVFNGIVQAGLDAISSPTSPSAPLPADVVAFRQFLARTHASSGNEGLPQWLANLPQWKWKDHADDEAPELSDLPSFLSEHPDGFGPKRDDDAAGGGDGGGGAAGLGVAV